MCFFKNRNPSLIFFPMKLLPLFTFEEFAWGVLHLNYGSSFSGLYCVAMSKLAFLNLSFT